MITAHRILAVEVERVCCKHDCEDESKSHQVKFKTIITKINQNILKKKSNNKNFRPDRALLA